MPMAIVEIRAKCVVLMSGKRRKGWNIGASAISGMAFITEVCLDIDRNRGGFQFVPEDELNFDFLVFDVDIEIVNCLVTCWGEPLGTQLFAFFRGDDEITNEFDIVPLDGNANALLSFDVGGSRID